jgi:hypothetical protein
MQDLLVAGSNATGFLLEDLVLLGAARRLTAGSSLARRARPRLGAPARFRSAPPRATRPA